MPNLTYEEARALLARAVEEKGADYVYPADLKDNNDQCVYFAEGGPACIIGHVAAYLGITQADVDSHMLEGQDAETFVQGLGLHIADDHLGTALRQAQAMQDDGYPWAWALRAFEWAYEHHQNEVQDPSHMATRLSRASARKEDSE